MKTVVITGANRGLGLGFVSHYSNMGWQVVALSRGALNESILNHNKLTSFQVDLSDETSIKRVANKIKDLTNGIDLLINNAGIAEHEAFGEWTQTALLNNYLINTVAPALLTQALSDQLRNGSKLIQLSSGLASIKNSEGLIDSFDGYSMSKTAINMLTQRLATRLKSRQIIVNAISPGWVKTDMGGEEAPTSMDEAIEIITNTIRHLHTEDNGLFLDEYGKAINW